MNIESDYRARLTALLDLVADHKHMKAEVLIEKLRPLHWDDPALQLAAAWSGALKYGASQDLERLRKTIDAASMPSAQWVEIAESMLKAKDVPAAELAIKRAKINDLAEQHVLLLNAKFARAQGDHAGELAALASLVEVPGTNPRYARLRLAELRENAGDKTAALTVLEQNAAANPTSVFAWDRLAELAFKTGDAESTVKALSTLIDLQPQSRSYLRRLMLSLQFMGREPEAIAIARRAIESADELDLDLCKALTRVKLPLNLEEKIIACATKALDADTAEDRASAQHLFYMLERPVPDAETAPINEAGSQPAHIKLMHELLRKSPPDAALKRPLVKRGALEEVSIAHADDPAVLAFVFMGLADRFSFPTNVFDRYLAALNISAVYLGDQSRMLFGNGLETLGGSFESTLSHLRSIARESGAKRIVTIGTSAGGFAAIRYGVAMGCDAVLGFSAATDLSAEFHKEDGRAPIVLKRLQSLPPEALRLRDALKDTGQAETAIHLYYGAKMVFDGRHAKNIADKVGVTLHPVHTLKDHAAAAHLVQRDLMTPILREIVLAEDTALA